MALIRSRFSWQLFLIVSAHSRLLLSFQPDHDVSRAKQCMASSLKRRGRAMGSKQEAGTWSHLEESLSVTDEKPIGLRLVLAVKGVQSKTLLLKDQIMRQTISSHPGFNDCKLSARLVVLWESRRRTTLSVHADQLGSNTRREFTPFGPIPAFKQTT